MKIRLGIDIRLIYPLMQEIRYGIAPCPQLFIKRVDSLFDALGFVEVLEEAMDEHI